MSFTSTVVFAADEIPIDKAQVPPTTLVPTWKSPINLWLRIAQIVTCITASAIIIVEFVALTPFLHGLHAVLDGTGYDVTTSAIAQLASTVSAQVSSTGVDLTTIRSQCILQAIALLLVLLVLPEGCFLSVGHLFIISMDIVRAVILIVTTSFNFKYWINQDCSAFARSVTVDVEDFDVNRDVIAALGEKIERFFMLSCQLNHGLNVMLPVLVSLFIASAEKRYQTIETVREDKLPRFWAAVVRFVSACDVES
ncbi:hypothetical protein MRB53_040443 [Persea americana]|nr:hypothetical protein MRB53_040443 [Persea americana]